MHTRRAATLTVFVLLLTLTLLPANPFAAAPDSPPERAPERAIILRSGLMLVPVRVNEAGPFLFLVDTGSTDTLVSRALASRLALAVTGADDIATLGGIQPAGRGQIATLDISNLRLTQVPVYCVDLRVVQQDDRRIEGVIGQSVLRERSFLLDYADGRLLFDEDGALRGIISGTSAPLTFIAGRPAAMVGATTADKTVPVALRLVLDSASREPILLHAPEHEAVGTLIARREPTGYSALGTLAGERVVPVFGVRLDALLFPTIALRGIDATVVPLSDDLRRVEDGLLPTHLFRALYFDHEAGTVVLNPKIGRWPS